MNIRDRLFQIGRSTRTGIAFLALGLLSTVMWMQIPSTPAGAHSGSTTHSETGVRLQASLSHPKIVQGSDGTVYLDLKIATPDGSECLSIRPGGCRDGRLPSDILVVLDRSGSMGEGEKWRYATQAVHSLLDRLRPGDRVGLVTFDTAAEVASALIPADPANLRRLRGIVDGLAPGASTNIWHALVTAEAVMTGGSSRNLGETAPSDSLVRARTQRVLLLSDGKANVGVVDPEQLGAISRRLADRGVVVSSIGMGLGFNETLMASLADLGMGRFSYLENLESLGAILGRELDDSRLIYAEGSEIKLELPSGVELLDVAGYPFELRGRHAVIRTGQLLQGTERNFIATLRVPNHSIAEYPLGTVELDYRAGGRRFQQSIRPGGLKVACIAPDRKQEAIDSIDDEIYRQAWIDNNLGSVMRKVSDSVREGKREEAVQLLQDYAGRLDEADQLVPGVKAQAAPQLNEFEARVKEAFEGPDQKLRQNRAAKLMLGASQEMQRKTEKQKPPR